MNILGSANKTADGSVTVPVGTLYAIAMVNGSVNPPVLNGNFMDPQASVPAQGVLKAVSIHTRALPMIGDLNFAMNGADEITFIFVDSAVCVRAVTVSGFNSSTGTVTGNLPTSAANDVVFGIVIGANGQVTLKGDTVALTLVKDAAKHRAGYITPGDSSLTCEGYDPGTVSRYEYQPPAIRHPGALITSGYWQAIRINRYMTWACIVPGSLWYVYSDGVYAYSQSTQPNWKSGSYFADFTSVYVPAVYASDTWEYPPKQWIETGTSGQAAAAFISVADVMIGANYISRPLIC